MGFRKTFLKKKRASAIIDVLLLFVAVFGFVMFTIVGFTFFDSFNNLYQNSTVIDIPQAKSTDQDAKDRYVNLFDGIFLFLFIGLILGAIAAAWYVDVAPMWFIVALSLLGVLAFLGALFGNIFSDFASSPQLNPSAVQFTFMSLIFNNFLTITIGIIFVVMIVGFAKYRISS